MQSEEDKESLSEVSRMHELSQKLIASLFTFVQRRQWPLPTLVSSPNQRPYQYLVKNNPSALRLPIEASITVSISPDGNIHLDEEGDKTLRAILIHYWIQHVQPNSPYLKGYLPPAPYKKDMAWVFSRGAWQPIEEYIYRAAEEVPDILQYAREQAGYHEEANIRIGEPDSGYFHVDVFFAQLNKPARYPYFVEFRLADRYEFIYVPDFPSLVMLLHQLSTIAGAEGNSPPTNEQGPIAV